MNQKVFDSAREVLGNYIADVMKEKGITLYKLEQLTGKPSQPLKSVITGANNYNVDTLLAVIQALDLYVFFAPKDGKHLDIEDMEKKLLDNDPKL